MAEIIQSIDTDPVKTGVTVTSSDMGRIATKGRSLFAVSVIEHGRTISGVDEGMVPAVLRLGMKFCPVYKRAKLADPDSGLPECAIEATEEGVDGIASYKRLEDGHMPSAQGVTGIVAMFCGSCSSEQSQAPREQSCRALGSALNSVLPSEPVKPRNPEQQVTLTQVRQAEAAVRREERR